MIWDAFGNPSGPILKPETPMTLTQDRAAEIAASMVPKVLLIALDKARRAFESDAAHILWKQAVVAYYAGDLTAAREEGERKGQLAGAESAWRPISEAPKGTDILVSDGDWFWVGNCSDDSAYPSNHYWQRLPVPPQTSTDGG